MGSKLPTKLMKLFWRLHDATRFPPFEWVGDWFEDHFSHAYSPGFIQGLQEAREDIAAGRFDVVNLEEFRKETTP